MAIGRPAILVPLPHALDDNQTPNADMLAQRRRRLARRAERSDAGITGRDADDDFCRSRPIWRAAPPPRRSLAMPRRRRRRFADVVETTSRRAA